MPAISVEFIADVQATANKLGDILTDVDSWLQWQLIELKRTTPQTNCIFSRPHHELFSSLHHF
jgi:hypothetical protein